MTVPLDLYWSYIHHHCSSWSCNLNWVMCFASLAFEFCIWIRAGRFCGALTSLLFVNDQSNYTGVFTRVICREIKMWHGMLFVVTLSSCNRFAHERTSEWHCKCMG
jgi:hypothetical protein